MRTDNIKLLIVSGSEEEFEPFFESVESVELDQVAPQVMDGEKMVKVGDKSIEEYDTAYIQIPEKNAVFGRVFIEMAEEKGLKLNTTSTGFYIMAKKNYLYYVLNQKSIPSPNTVVVPSEKASRNLEKELELPLIGREIDEFEEVEQRKLESQEEISEFAEGMEYGSQMLIFHEFSEGDKHRCLVIGESIISVKDDSSGWKFGKDNLKYSNISDTKKEAVKNAVNSIGAPVAEVLLRGEEVYDINPNPDLGAYSDAASQNLHEKVAEMLKEGSE